MKNLKCQAYCVGLIAVIMVSLCSARDGGIVIGSVAFPGMGQLSNGQTAKGLSIMASEALLISLTFNQMATMNASEYETKYRKIEFERGGSYTDVNETFALWQDAYNRTNKAKVNTWVFGGLSVGLWVLNIADAFFFQKETADVETSLLHTLRKNMQLSATTQGATLNYTVQF